MSPVQRRKRLSDLKRKKNGSSKFRILRFLPFFFLAFAFIVFLFFGKRCYSPQGKTGIVINTKSGDILIAVFDPKAKEVNSFTVPGNTQLIVSRNLGTWKVKSVWKLGQDEKYSGELLRETVIKSFHIPIIAWADEGAIGFTTGNFIKIVKAMFVPYKSNLSLADKIHMGIFVLGLKNDKNINYSSQLPIFKKTRLIDGEEGYILSGDLPSYLTSLFSETLNESGIYKISIYDATGERSIAEEVGISIENMGVKVMSIKKEDKSDFDCRVSGKYGDFVKKMAQVFGCETVGFDAKDVFDIKIEIGEKFAERY